MKAAWTKFMTWPLLARTLAWDTAFWLLFLPIFAKSTPGEHGTSAVGGAFMGFILICILGSPFYLIRVLWVGYLKKQREKVEFQASSLGLATIPQKALSPQQVQELFTQNTHQGLSSALGAPVN